MSRPVMVDAGGVNDIGYQGRARRTYKFQLRPTAGQVVALTACLDAHRDLYNAALQERRDAYRSHRVTVRYGDQSAQLRDIRRADESQGRWSFSSQQATLRRLDRAFAAFFRRVKAGQAPGYPRFRGRARFDSVEWPRDRDGCRWDSTPDHPTQTRVYLQGVGHVKVNQHRPTLGTVKTISVKREARRWYVILSCDDVPVRHLPATGAAVGVDMGVTSFLTTSDGAHVPNPRYLAASAARLAAAQQALSRTRRGSARRRKMRARVAAIHRKVARQRLDFQHKTALDLVRDHDVIAVEALRVANMIHRAKPVPDPDRPGAFLPNGAAAKSGLNRSILDAGWGCFLQLLHAKAESAGRTVIEVNPANTSRTCARCGYCSGDNRRTQADFRCVQCGHHAHADVNGAVNILRAGLARQAAQAA
jgi:putative transposase